MANARQKLMVRWGGISLVFAIGLCFAGLRGIWRGEPTSKKSYGSTEGVTNILDRSSDALMNQLSFEDSARKAGIDFHHFPASRASLLPEDMGSGVAWADYDNDEDPDLYLVNFSASILDPVSARSAGGRSALYRNNGAGSFTDVSDESGLATSSFGLAACWGDYDNDGDLDLYSTAYGPNMLFNNNGDGTFTEITEQAGVSDESFSAGCSWGDYDRDGHIDLYTCNYVRFNYQSECRGQATQQYGSVIPYTINPSSYRPESNRLFRNNGDGTFVDVAESAGVANPTGRSLAATWFDFDNDGSVDLYVANDVSENGVYRNLGDGTFEDIGASSMAADYRGAMGLAVGDFDHDKDLDLFVTHWIAQENALFENMLSEDWKDAQGKRRLFFMDAADLEGLGQISLSMVGWATGFDDFDNDGYLDLWVVNGNTLEMDEDSSKLKPQMMHLFHHRASEGFFEGAGQACPTLQTPFVGRGAASADYDGDGKMDLAIMVHGGQPLLLHNTSAGDHHWLVLRLRQTGANTRALGAWVSLRSGELDQTAQVGAGGSYLSQNHSDLHFGLADSTVVDEVAIRWPDGAHEQLTDVAVDRVVEIVHVPNYGTDSQ